MITEVSILPIQSVYSIDNHIITATVLNEEPLLMKFDRVLSDEECQALIDSAASRLEKSKLANKEVSQIRTSSGMFFDENESPLITIIENRISSLMHVPIVHAEGLQVLKYEPGQEFKEHYDFFGSNNPSSDNNRMSTLIIYLNDVEEGGETTFPSLEITVKPVKGSAVYFEYFYSNQALNELTLHSGKPVIRGEKWVTTQWMRKQRIREC
ncbi:proline hydroxylase [Paenibacillus sp. MY03]|jgi:prolyl 4-hydroxylase|uniref:Proline hydroxylase n=1 Tax=Paenibacillus agaridevorans TaxID=171404 RepID=A0A2R5EVE5_9BACL|nr:MULTISPECIES: 2OG-Fe(II) oxygenase [Paenibacillus]OUS77222.1 proline hydroxylase [Paenibacillus sp. MY03]GBG07354.1 proline hydroxylase [Paenibacillus agaridevorans]